MRADGLRGGDAGAALILAMVLMLVISITTVAVANFAVGGGTTTYNLAQQRNAENNAASATSLAIQYMRTTYNPSAGNIFTASGGSEQLCLPSGLAAYPSSVSSTQPGPQMAVFCTATLNGYDKIPTRSVTFYTCATPGATSSNCVSGNSRLALQAVVSYNDIDPSYPVSNSSCTTTCGFSLSITSWDVTTADN